MTLVPLLATVFLAAAADAATVRARRPAIKLLSLRGGSVLGPLLLATPVGAAGMGPTQFPKMIDCVGAASGFFGNVRVPAALLTGAALGQLFSKPDDSRGKWVKDLFAVMMAITAMMEMVSRLQTAALIPHVLTRFSLRHCFQSVVFVSTATATRLMGGGFDPIATDAISFLIRESSSSNSSTDRP